MSNARDIADAGHQLVARVTFDGTLDTGGGAIGTGDDALIKTQYNVSSVDFVETGVYQINMTNSVGADYTVSGSASRSGFTGNGDSANMHLMNGEDLSDGSSFRVRTHLSRGSSSSNALRICVTVFA